MMRNTKNKRFFDKDAAVSTHHRRVVNSTVFIKCPVCCAEARRLNAKFCAVCGHDLREGYVPLDTLRASYSLRKQSGKQMVTRQNSNKMPQIVAADSNGAARTAMAFVVYSLVPYLGILFCPGALIWGSISLAVSINKPQLGGRQSATFSLLFGSTILAIQIMLWWLLYIIPELKR